MLLARQLAAGGARVSLTARRQAVLEEVVLEIEPAKDYGTLAVIWFTLMRKHAAEGAPQVASDQTPTDDTDDEAPLAFAY